MWILSVPLIQCILIFLGFNIFLMSWLSHEKRATSSLAVLYAIRMLGLFMVVPVLALYAENYEAATPTLIGFAIGAYGLTQALLQLPLGWISDQLGRKPIIIAGLAVFALGSLIAATADDMYWLIAGRLLQGAGAIAGTLMALLSDLTREHIRSKAMAVIGLSIGFSFVLAMLVGPTLSSWRGLSGLFELTALMAVFGIVIVMFWVPSSGSVSPAHTNPLQQSKKTPQQSKTPQKQRTDPKGFFYALTHPELLRLNFGIGVLHAVLIALFLMLPHWINTTLERPLSEQGWFYLPVMLLTFVIMMPFLRLAETKHQFKPLMLAAIALLSLALAALPWAYSHPAGLVICILVFFTAFNWLEAVLPSLVSKLAPESVRGTAMSAYSSCQFFGAFIGGAAGGYLIGKYGTLITLYVLAGVVALWWLIALRMRPPRPLSAYRLVLPDWSLSTTEVERKLKIVPGVAEVNCVPTESAAYLKVDKTLFDPQRAKESLNS